MDWLEAADLMASARCKSDGKPIANNTRLYESGEDDKRTFIIRHWSTNIIEIYPDDTYRLDTGGWMSVTTWQRINSYAPSLKYVYDRTLQKKLGSTRLIMREPEVWADDPEPERPDRTIFPPFHAADPGPEPIDDGIGCIAGTTDEYEWQDYDTVFDFQIDRLKPQRFVSRRNVYGGDELHIVQHTAGVARIFYGASQYQWGESVPTGHKYKQCQHCAAFDKLHEAWYFAYHGSRWGRDSGKGWKLYRERMDEYGSVEKWRQAALCDFRNVKEMRAQWREWAERNCVPYFEGIIVTSDGYVHEKSYQQILKAERKALREARKRERERIAERKRIAAEKMAAAETWSRENAVKCKVDPDVVIWLIDHAVPINSDGKTVTLYKSVNVFEDSLRSPHDAEFVYKVGERAVAEDWDPYPSCGHGLHFWPTEDYARRRNWGEIMLECIVPIDEMVVAESDKIKSRYCDVVRIVEDKSEKVAA